MIDRRNLLVGAVIMMAPPGLARNLPTTPVRRRPPEVNLESHRREPLHWRRDIVDGKRASVIGLSFVGCTSQCPASDMLFQLLDSQAPPSVDLYTLTLTPLANDWRVLAARAEELGASERWRWLTGRADDVFAVLDGLDVSFSDPNSHSQTVVLAGRRRYERIDADRPELLPSVAQLVEAVS